MKWLSDESPSLNENAFHRRVEKDAGLSESEEKCMDKVRVARE